MMTTRRALIPCLLVVLVALATPEVRADTAAAPAPPAAADTWAGPDGIYRVIATSVGVLAGAGAMSLFIDGWVVDAFTSSSGMSAREAAAVVQDLDSQGGIEAAAILLAGLGGGLLVDHAYVTGVQVLPGAYQKTKDALAPSLDAVGTVWSKTSGWLGDRVGDTSDWVQARSREAWDRGQVWLNSLRPSPTTTVPAKPAAPTAP